MRQCYIIGYNSFPLVGLTGFIMGLVQTMQLRPSLVSYGVESQLPVMVGIAIVREIGPVITALIFAGKIASSMGAELGSMKVTEQIDAMEVSGTNPFKYLVVTRVAASTLMLPVLVLLGDGILLFGAWIGVNIRSVTSLDLFFRTDKMHHRVAVDKIRLAGEQLGAAGQQAGDLAASAKTMVKDSALNARLNASMENIRKGTEAFSQDMEALKHNFLLRGYFRRQEKKAKARSGKRSPNCPTFPAGLASPQYIIIVNGIKINQYDRPPPSDQNKAVVPDSLRSRPAAEQPGHPADPGSRQLGAHGSMFPKTWLQPGLIPEHSTINEPEHPLLERHHQMLTCPTLVILLYDTTRRAPASEGDFLGIMSLGCVLENMWLMATSLGIGFHVVSALANEPAATQIKQLLHIPPELSIAIAFRLGYPIAKVDYLRVRRDVNDFTHFNAYRAKKQIKRKPARRPAP